MARNQSQSKAHKLLLEYRPIVWRKSVLESAPGIGSNALQVCINQIKFTQELAEMLRNSNLGAKLYWIIYASYMTVQQPCDVAEILSHIAEKYERIPRSTYFRLRERAIRMMDEHLEKVA